VSITRHHNDWLRLVPNSGPFLSLPVLALTFPQGLHAHDAEHARRLRQAFGEWDDDQLRQRPDPVVHRAWVRFVLGETLGHDELLAEGQEIPQSLKSEEAQYGETLRPDWIVTDPATKKVRLLVQFYPRSQPLTKPVATYRWKTSPDTRMTQLLNDTGIRLGLVTNGHDWMLVNAPKNETTGYANWRADLWLEEPVTLRAFRTLLSADRFFSVPDAETLDLKGGLLDQSQKDQQEVTDQLGYQVRKAVEVVIQALDKADQDHGRKLLADVDEKALYESALTVMMRLVFLFCAEERELLLLGDDLYDKNYAVSTLREQLRLTADEFGEEILGLRYDAWTRLLTTFRAVYAGAKHDRLKLPAYGGSLFNPDRFPFLEGRKAGTSWKTTPATPLPVSNRTVLHLLEALQVLQTKVGKTVEARSLSFRSLDIEQIGHVYEGLLDHTAVRATEPVVGLAGTRDQEPEIVLAELEKIAAKGEKELLRFLKDSTGRSESALKKAVAAELDDQPASRFRTACQDSTLWSRVKPYAGLVRVDTVGYPVVITTGSVFVTAGSDRRSTGTHYTPKPLTEPIVQYTLEPLVFVGPAEGLPKEQWRLRPAKELLALRICDMACGSGAFLVQTCRYMAARLLEAWDAVQRANPGTVHITPDGEASNGKPGEMLIPDDPDERMTYALRIVAQRCLYGVDKNPLAVEMAKLSLWLLTLAKDKPFEFLDHNIRCGDSLVGIHNLEQLRKFNLDGKGEDNSLFLQFLDPKIKEAIALRRQITEMQANTVEDVEAQDRMLREANEKIDRLKCAADFLIAAEFTPGSVADKRAARDDAAIKVAVHFNESDLPTFRREAQKALAGQVTFHWPLEFPEAIVERGGFDAFVGNPPFLGGSRISGTFGDRYLSILLSQFEKSNGNSDICSFFIRRAANLISIQGCCGFIATNSVAKGETRTSGLQYLLDSGSQLIRATRSRPWPGTANVFISEIHFYSGLWKGMCVLDGSDVPGISSFLDAHTAPFQPFRLAKSLGLVFRGPTVGGEGFILTSEERQQIVSLDPRSSDVIFPFLTGQDINQDYKQASDRFAIDLADRAEFEASKYTACWSRLSATVRIQRQGNKIPQREKYWWRYIGRQEKLYEAIKGFSVVLTCGEVSKYWSVSWVSPHQVFAGKVVVFALRGNGNYAVLSSCFHTEWAEKTASRLKGDPAYSLADTFETFPFPTSLNGLEAIGERYHAHRKQIMLSRKDGLTTTYNRFHDPEATSTDIQKLRELHVEMDQAVAAVYGWADLNLDHEFHETKQGVRYTISEAARRLVLARLLTLNHERYAAEVKQGLHDTKAKRPATSKPKATATKQKSVAESATLFEEEDATFPSTERDSYLCGLVCDLVAAEPGLPVSAYVDSLVIALGHERHKRLLTGRDATMFAKLCKATPLVGWSATDKIPWAELSSLMHQRKAIEPEGEFFQVGSDWAGVRESYPAVAPELLALLGKAAAELRDLQAQVGSENRGTPDEIPAEKAEILRAFVHDRDQWYGVAA